MTYLAISSNYSASRSFVKTRKEARTFKRWHSSGLLQRLGAFLSDIQKTRFKILFARDHTHLHPFLPHLRARFQQFFLTI
mmetsp:Transcript_24508/g.35886  ORF Transcript_24508/g.35886 Transcript_24508/m.35886 type:complete len:80 (+) Transcript_24508:950-1189(+)